MTFSYGIYVRQIPVFNRFEAYGQPGIIVRDYTYMYL